MTPHDDTTTASDDPWDDMRPVQNANEVSAEAMPLYEEAGKPYTDVVDADATELNPKPVRRWGPMAVIIIVGVGAVGIALNGLWSVYQQIFPSRQAAGGRQVQAEVGVEVRDPVREPPAGSTPSNVIGLNAASTPGPAIIGIQSGVLAAPEGTTVPFSRTDTVVPAGPSASPAPPGVDPAASELRPQLAASPTVPAVAPKVAPQPAPAQQPAVTAPPATSVAVDDGAAAKRERPAVTRERHAAKPPRSVSQTTRTARADAKKPGSKHVAPEAEASGVTSAPMLDAEALGKLSAYKVISISPMTGQFQMAWVRKRNGQIVIVAAGDSVDGMRVKKVDGESFLVTTSHGDIR